MSLDLALEWYPVDDKAEPYRPTRRPHSATLRCCPYIHLREQVREKLT